MPIVLLRVDERLIHGQVVVGWGERIHMDRIAVIDDELSGSTWEQELYCLGVPATTEALFVSVEEAHRLLPEWAAAADNVAVLTRNVDTLRRLAADGLLRGMQVNLGGLHSAPSRERVLPYLYLSDGEKDQLREIAASGAEITARDLPASRAIPLTELLDRD